MRAIDISIYDISTVRRAWLMDCDHAAESGQNSEPEFGTRYGNNIPSSQPSCYAILTRNYNNNKPHAAYHVCTICICKLSLYQQNLKRIQVKNKHSSLSVHSHSVTRGKGRLHTTGGVIPHL